MANIDEFIRVLGLTSDRDATLFLESVLAAAPVFITRVDLNYHVRYINYVQPGLELNSVIGADVFSFIAPAYRATARACFEHVIATGRPAHYESVASGPSGTLSRYENHVAPILDEGCVVGLCIVGLDVTRYVEQARELQESEEKLRLALDATGIGLWSMDLTTNEATWDQRMREITGRDTPLAIDQYTEILVHPDDREHVIANSALIAKTKEFRSAVYRIVRPAGDVRWILTVGRLLKDHDGTPRKLVGGNIDVTDQRMVEDQLRQAQKMEAIGVLAAGIAHNFNNMLAVILPAFEILEDFAPPTYQEILDDAKETAHRAASVVRQLMTYAGQSRAFVRERLNLSELLRRVTHSCRQIIEPHIRLTLECDGEVYVPGDAAQLEQVFVNILLNARRALLDHGGDLPLIAVSCQSSKRLVHPTASAVPFAHVQIADNGRGMSRDTKRRIFEPFFTTNLAQGTGLGLATSQAIVRDLGGWIDCDSAPDMGATFHVWLPLIDDARVEVAESAGGGLAGKAVRILLVEDEPAVRRVATHILLHSGYEIVVAEDGIRALEVVTGDGNFDLVLLDRSLPKVPGATLLPEIRARAPRARVVYFTGEIVSLEERGDVDAVLHKPVERSALLACVKAVLESRP